MMTRCNLPLKRWLFAFLFLITSHLLVTVTAQTLPVDPALLKKAVAAAQDKELATSASEGDVVSLYKIAKQQLEKSKDDETSLQILHALADNESNPHILSQVALGFSYYEAGDSNKAIFYFSKAGESGPHQAALYNAGRIFAEKSEWVPAMAYMQGCITLKDTHPTSAAKSLTDTCLEAYDILSENIAIQDENQRLTIEEAADLFLYGSVDDFPKEGSEAGDHWKTAITSIHSFNETLAKKGQVKINELEKAAVSLRKLWESESSSMSKLQAHFVLKNMNRVLGLLSASDDAYLAAAAGYAEALALSPYCSQMAASSNKDPLACFNQAMSDAMVYRRRSGDVEGTKRVLENARQHPKAATSWKSLEQTPMIYESDKSSGKPWHSSKDFPAITNSLNLASKIIKMELQEVKVLPEGKIYAAAFRTFNQKSDASNEMEVSATGDISTSVAGIGFHPTIHLHTKLETSSKLARAEYGPIYNGEEWDQDKCQKMPSLCQALKTLESNIRNVKVVRLRSGTSVLPHCGKSTGMLMMYHCLEGCEGVDITVGGLVVKDFQEVDSSQNNNVVIFDSSYEHSIAHKGSRDSYFIVVTISI